MANIFDQFDPRPPETPSTTRRNVFDEFGSATNQRSEENNEFFGQGFVSDFGIGTGNLVSGIGTLYGLASGNMDNTISRFGEETTSFYDDLQTEDQKRRQTQFQQYVDGGADELDKAGRAIVGTITDPSLTFSFLTQQIPLLVGSGGAGLAVRGATGAVRAGQAAGVLSGAGLNAGDIAGGMYSDVMQLPEDVLEKNDGYLVRKAEIGAGEARKELALEGARNTALAVGALSTVTAGALPSTIEKTLIGGVAEGTTRIGNLSRGFISEALQEAIEEGGGQAIANLNIQPIDPSRSLTEGVGQSAAQGGLLGGLMGGGVGFISPNNRISEAAERGANKAREAGGDALDQSASAAQATAQVSTTDTINGRSGQTTIEMQGNQADVEALRGRFGINQGRIEPTLTTADTTLPDPNNAPLQAATFSPLLTPTPFDALSNLDLATRSINRAVVLNARDQRRAATNGDQAAVNALEDDSVKLRALQSRIRSARELQALPEQERVAGQSEMIENILSDVGEAITQESGARQAFSYVNVLEGELLPRIDESLQAMRELGTLTERPALRAPADFEVNPDDSVRRPRSTTEQPDISGIQARENLIEDQNIIYGEQPPAEAAPQRTTENAIDNTVPVEAYEESNLKPVDVRFDGLVEAYELGDVDPLVRELNAVAGERGALLTRRMNTPITTDDDVLTAITKAGGIDLDEAVSQGLDPADNPGRGRMSLFRRQGGMTFDGVAEFLADNGFTKPTGETYEAGVQGANEALGIVADALNARGDGNLTFLNSGRGAQIESLAQREMEIEQDLEEIRTEIGENLTPQDEVLLDQFYEEMYDEVYGSVDQRTATTEAPRQTPQAGRDDDAGRGRRGEIDSGAIPSAEGVSDQAIRQDDGPPQENLVTTQTEPQGSVSRSGTQRTWTPRPADRLAYLGKITRDGRPGREDPKRKPKKDYEIGEARPIEGRPGAFAREIRDPKGELVGVVEAIEGQATSLYLDTAGSYDVFEPTIEPTTGEFYDSQENAAVYAVMDRHLKQKKGEAVKPAEFSGKTEAPLLESYTEQDLQDRDAAVARANELAPPDDPNKYDPNYRPMRAQDLKSLTGGKYTVEEAQRITEENTRTSTPAYSRVIRTARTENPEAIGIIESLPDASIARYFDDAEPQFEVFTGYFGDDNKNFSQKVHERRALSALINRHRERTGQNRAQSSFMDEGRDTLTTYTEEELREREERDTGAAEQRAQVDRERELFGLDSGEGTIAGTNDPTQTDGNQGGLFRREGESGVNRGATRRPVVTDEEFDTVISRVVGDNPEARARIVSVDSFTDLPEILQAAARKQGSDGSDVDAVTHRGQVYVVRGRMRSKARLERTLLHEGTHVGIDAMYADEGVRKAMNRMYVAMGGQKGFRKMARELDIQQQLARYEEGTAGGQVPEDVRNEILVNEMLAYVGERGSKKLKDRVAEAIGAIRNWLRKNGLMALSYMRVSDISYLAKRARENGLRSAEAKGNGEPAFSIVAEQSRARPTGMGLYSNAEQILLDQGDKIFKPSKKNPEGKVGGDQILSFLKARGLKKEESAYTGLEEELTQLASESGKPARFTRDEVIQLLRDNAPELVADVRSGITSEDSSYIFISDPEVLDDQENWEHIITDMRDDIFDLGTKFGSYSSEKLFNALYDYDPDILKSMASFDFPNMRMATVDAKLLYEAYAEKEDAGGDSEFLAKRLISTFGESYVDDTIVKLAEQQYLDDPYFERVVENNDEEQIGRIVGNDDVGYRLVNNNNEEINTEIVYDIDEARVQFQMWAIENDEVGNVSGETQYFDYLKIPPSDVNDYREIAVTLENNRLSDATFKGGHFDVENALFHILATDRDTDFGNTLTIEEAQSDWHSDIRRNGLADPDALAVAEEKFNAANTREEESAGALRRKRRIAANRADALNVLQVFYVESYYGKKGAAIALYGEFIKEIEPRLTEEGLAWIRKFSSGLDTDRPIREQIEDTDLTLIYEALVEPVVVGYGSGEGSEADRYWTDEARKDLEAIYRFPEEALEQIEYQSRKWQPFSALLGDGQSADALYRKPKDGVVMMLNYGLRDADLSPMRDESVAVYDAIIEHRAAEKDRVETREARDRLRRAPPDSPFRNDQYLDLVAKITLRDAVSEGKTGLAFSKGDRVQNRWSDNYDYEAIYNRKLKKAMDKLMGAPAQSMDDRGRLETGDDVSSDGFWAYQITPELAENVRENGLPMFRRDGSDGRMYPKKPVEERMREKFLRGLVDKFLPVYRAQQAIEVENERELDIAENPYLTEELFYGKTEEDLRQIELRLIEPLISKMKDAGVTADQLNDYLYAKHAPERNRVIRETNPEFEGTGSGMSDAEAAEIVGQYTGEKLQQMEDLAARVYQMTQLTRDLLRASGLQTDEVTDSWEAVYENYVPLRGFAENEQDAKGRRIGTGRGFDIRGKESRRAYGRQSRAQGPLAQVIADLTQKTIRNRKNEVSKAFLQMVENNPDPSQWQVFTDADPDPAALRGPNANKRSAQMEMARSEGYLGVKRDGVVHYIKIKDRKLLDAMQNVGPEQMGVITRFIGGITRFLSSVNTAYDPTFVVTNFTRDIQAALINIAGEQTKEGGLIEGERIGAKVAKGTPKAVAAIRNYTRNKKVGDGDSEYEAYFKEFLDVGAKTGYFDSPDLDVLEKRLAARINQGEGVFAKGKAGARWVGEFVSDYNLAVENGVRLSAYIEARKAGIAKPKAASLAKNLTVNFNRKGSAGAAINSWYMFFNAAVQGLKQFTTTLSPIYLDAEGDVKVQRNLNRAQKIAGGLVGIAYAAAVFNREVGGEDDDGESFYDKINPSIRERNLILMKPDGSGEYYKMPLPYGYNFFYTIGTTVEALQNGSSRRKENALGEVFASFVTAFSPISVHANAGISASPTVFVPFFELGTNTNFFGSDIVRENFPSGPQRASAHNYWNSTKEPYVAIAQFLNDTVGSGSEYRSGKLGFMFDISTDISPDTIEHIMEFGLGGIYRAGMGGVDAVARATSDREIDYTRMPFASKVLGRNDSDYADQERFYDTRQLIINARKEREDARGKERIESDKANNSIHRLYPTMLSTEKFLSLQRDRRDKVRDDEELSESERDEKLKAIRERMDDRIDRFNQRYQEHLEKYAG